MSQSQITDQGLEILCMDFKKKLVNSLAHIFFFDFDNKVTLIVSGFEVIDVFKLSPLFFKKAKGILLSHIRPSVHLSVSNAISS